MPSLNPCQLINYNFTLVTMLLKTNQLVADSYQCHNRHPPPPWKSAKSWTCYFAPFFSLKAYERSRICFVERYYVLHAQLSLDYQEKIQLFFLILNVDIFLPHFHSHYHYFKLYISHIHQSYCNSSFVGPPGTICFSSFFEPQTIHSEASITLIPKVGRHITKK